MIWTLNHIADAVQGQLHHHDAAADVSIDGISLDNRKTNQGDLFIAIQGVNHDGHDYIASAAEAGAVAAMVNRPLDASIPQIVVKDSLDGLTALGYAARARSHARITAITGSVGKTGSRHLIATCLGAIGKTHATKGNYNNHIGAPMSLALMPQDCDYGVFELGMNHAGEIASLSPMMRPDVAVITRIASTHAGNFKSLDDIAAAKGEIFDGLNKGGVAVLNADDPYTPMLAELALKKGASRVITCGHHADADGKITAITRRENGLLISAELNGTPVEFSLKMMAPHWAMSALMGLAITQYFGGDIDQACAALAEAHDLDGRGARHYAEISGGRHITVIDDSYNASPASVSAALASLADDPAKGRRVAILADMLELGSASDQLHGDLISAVVDSKAELLITFGPAMVNLTLAAKQYDHIQTCHADNARDAIDLALMHLHDGDVVLIKGSNGMKTSQMTAALTPQSSDKGGYHAA